MLSGTNTSSITPQQSFAYLSSTNLVYRDALPPEYRMPTLLGGDSTNLRGLNTIDNEENIPDFDFREALYKFDIEPSEINQNKRDNLRKTFSENETSNYDDMFGKKLPYKRTKTSNLITDWGSYYAKAKSSQLKKSRDFYKAEPNDGICDEYVPNLSSFNLSKFGINDPALEKQSFKEESGLPSKPRAASISAQNSEISLEIKAHHPEVLPKPIEIDYANKASSRENQKDGEYFEVSAKSFKIADSPERETDRIILSSIPKNFQSLSFSYRRKMLTDLLPDSLKDDAEYKNHLTKILRRNSTSTSSLGSMASMIASARHRKITVPPNSNEMGSLLMSTWKLGRVFNNGSFGIIRECFNIENVDEVKAVKIIPIKQSIKKLYKSQSEIFIWSKLHHKYVIPLLDVQITCDNIFLLMPLFPEGSLFDKVKVWETNKISFEKRHNQIIQYITGIVKSIKYLHHQGIHHGDIKLENFLLHNDVPIICDFGLTNYDLDSYNHNLKSGELDVKIKTQINETVSKLSKRSYNINSPETCSSDLFGSLSSSGNDQNTDKSVISAIRTNESINETPSEKNNIGSLPYAAPELLQSCPISVDRKADIWAFGITVFALIVLKLPFWHIYEPRLKLMILEGNWKSEDWKEMIHQFSEINNFEELIDACLIERSKRENIDQISEKVMRQN